MVQTFNKIVGERKVFFCKAAIDLLDKLLTLDPDQRMSAADALDSDYFWTDPMPTPKEKLPQMKSCYEWTKKNLNRKAAAATSSTGQAPVLKKHKP